MSPIRFAFSRSAPLRLIALWIHRSAMGPSLHHRLSFAPCRHEAPLLLRQWLLVGLAFVHDRAGFGLGNDLLPLLPHPAPDITAPLRLGRVLFSQHRLGPHPIASPFRSRHCAPTDLSLSSKRPQCIRRVRRSLSPREGAGGSLRLSRRCQAKLKPAPGIP